MTETEYIIAPRIPQGLAPAVEGLAREILRHKPRDIYTFAARHFAELVELRDKECTAGIAPKLLDCKSFNERDYMVNWAEECNESNVAVSKNEDHCTGRNSYGNLTDEAMVLKEPVTSTIMKKAMLSKKNRETRNKSGWSINRTVKVFKKHEYASSVEKGEKLSNMQINGKEMEKITSGYPEYRSPRFLRKLTCGQFLRSSSVGSIFGKNSKSREERENGKIRSSFALDKYAVGKVKEKCDKGYNINASDLIRQKSADQILNISTCIKDRSVDVGIVGRRRSRSLVNNGNESKFSVEERDLKNQWKSTVEGERKQEEKLEEKFAITKESGEKLNLRLGKANEEYSKGKEIEEILISESRSEISQQNDTLDDTVNKESIDIDGRISVILPSVVTRQLSGKCTKNNVYGSNVESNAGNLILPPISSGGLKTMKKESNVTLPSLSNDVDAWLVNEETMYRDRNEDSSSNQYCNDEAEKQVELMRNIEGTKVIGKDWKGEDVKWSKDEGNGRLSFRENIIVEDGRKNMDKVEGPEEIEEYSNSQEADTEEMFFRDSLNVTPDSIDLSQRPDSLEHVGNEKAAGEEQCRPNELERKLIEIETVEKSIENTLASSERIAPCVNGSEGSCSIRFLSNEENRESDEPNRVYGEDIIVDGERNRDDESWVKSCCEERKERKKIENSWNEEDENAEGNRAIDSAESEVGNGKSFSDNSEMFIGADIDSRLDIWSIEERCNEFKRGDDHSCYVLTEGSPCEIPETVTTVIIPDKICQVDDEVCKVEEITTNDAMLGLKEPIFSGYAETGKEREKGYWHEASPFGEYIRENLIDYSTSLNANFLSGIRNAGERMSACQDLGNIKEEEENESDNKLSSNVTQHNIGQVIDYSENMPESMKYEKSMEYEGNLMVGFSNPERNNIDINSSPREEDIKKKEDSSDDFSGSTRKSARERKEEGGEMLNDHWGNFSLSLEEAEPQVPELNLDSLRDTTTSSIEKSDSARIDQDIRRRKENNDISFVESENTSLSSSNCLPAEEKQLPREDFFIQPKDQVTEIGKESDKYIAATTKFENDDSVDTFSSDKNGKDCHCMEEEIAKELIRNFILDASAVEGNSCKYQTNNMMNQTDDVAIKFRSSVRVSTPETAIEVRVRKEEIENIRVVDEEEEDEKVGKRDRGDGEENERGSESEAEGDERKDQMEIAFLENQQMEEEEENVESVGARHTGEFHDSLPLPFIEIPKSVPSMMNIYDLKAVYQGVDGRVDLPGNIMGNRSYTRIPSTTFSNYKSSPITVPCGIGFLKNFNLLVHKSDWTELPLNTSPCVIRIDHMFEEAGTINKAVVPLAKRSSNVDTDDLREPLALDNSPKPIVIEEISDCDNGNEQMLPFYKADNENLTKETSSFSSDDHYDFNRANDERKNTLDASLSEVNKADRFVENDNSNIGTCADFADPSGNSLEIVKDEICSKGENKK